MGSLPIGLSTPAILRLRIRPSLRRSEEHTSELQSQSNLVCRLLLANKTPDRSVDGRPLDFFDGAEEIFQPAVERRRIRLDVEEEVEGRRLPQGGQATTALAVTWRH